MFAVQEYRELKSQLESLESRLESLKANQALQKELEFEKKLQALLNEYGKSPLDIVAMVVPNFEAVKAKAQLQQQPQRRTRTMKVYINPKSGERVETKGGNHKVLKSWKLEHGSDAVESWLQR